MKRFLLVIGFSVGLGGISSFARAESPAEPPLPVVFAHGLGITGWAYEAILPLKRFFERRGHPLLIAHTPANGSLEERGACLRDEIARLVPSGRFHLIGHSMGGLDARLVVHHYGLGGRVASVTTLATPHHGSPVADFVLDRIDAPGASRGAVTVLEKLFGGDLKAARDLTPAHMDEIFNAQVKDDPRVRYFSMGFFIPEPVSSHSIVPWLWLTHSVLTRAGYPRNDAMVSVESARWGESLGELPGDHYSETGPVPLAGGPGYLEVFSRVLDHLEQNVEK